MLTKKQNELLIYINQNLRETGVAPSYEEMREALDLRSKSGIHRLINALEERGFIRRLPHRARAIEVTKLPSASSQNKNANFNPELINSFIFFNNSPYNFENDLIFNTIPTVSK